jgi:hypothetical protein
VPRFEKNEKLPSTPQVITARSTNSLLQASHVLNKTKKNKQRINHDTRLPFSPQLSLPLSLFTKCAAKAHVSS